MIWAKTEAGRIEMQAKAVLRERAQRTLLLLIDGHKPENLLLSQVAGIAENDFKVLHALGLIAAAETSRSRAAAAPADAPPAALDYARFTAALTQIISKQLGLRGFPLTLAVEKTSSIEELRKVAERTLELVRERKGEIPYSSARRQLYG